MKLLITTLAMIFISFGANALSVEKLYKDCKPYQSNGFSTKNLSFEKQISSIACLSYLRGIRDKGDLNCKYLKGIKKAKAIDIESLRVLSLLLANSKASISSVITSFINYAENHPENWKYTPDTYSKEYLSDKFPCKLDE